VLFFVMAQPIIIIGGGVIGLCSAYYAARAGFKVTVLEKQAESRDGCSFGNAGMIVPSHFVPLAAPGMVALGLKWMWNPESPFYVKPRLSPSLLEWGYRFWRAATPDHVARCAPLIRDLSLLSRSLFEELVADGLDFGLTKEGLLMLCKTRHGLAEETAAASRAQELGLPAEVLDPGQAAALDPGVTMDIAGAVYYPKDCHLSPNRLIAAITERCRSLGVKFLWETEILGWKMDRKHIAAIITSAGELTADQYVLCAGSWTPETLRGLPLRLPMQAGKGYSLTLPNPRQISKICAIFSEARIAVTPMNGAMRFGGTMEIAGMNEAINPRRIRGIVKAIPQYYPAFQEKDFTTIKPWHGLRPCSPDGMPYLGRTAAAQNLIIATGHAMMGLSLGPVTGQVVSQLLADQPIGLDLQLLRPDRFGSLHKK
jgi:D-amino-acid dehydrogenase